ncbi:MAG: nuclear transport factor 2 family protein [Novosphingobium sp.]|nr:nuclear transport factor 2 family protein [Novosphingobium sp.]
MAHNPQLIADLETRFWQSMVDKDADAAMKMIAQECLIAGPTGTMKIDPEEYGEMTRDGQWSLEKFELKDTAVVFPAEDVAVIAYKVHQTGEMKGSRMDLSCADTSTWVRQDGEWKCSAHTETILDQMPRAA